MEPTNMNKMKLHTPDSTRENIRTLMHLFPNCVRETRDADGGLNRAVDFDQLRQHFTNTKVTSI